MFLAPEIPISVGRIAISDGAPGIFDTLRLMRRLVNDYKTNPQIRQAAIAVAFLTPAQDELSEIESVFSFVRDHIRYTQDVYGVETLATPDKTLLLRVGDCDDMTVLLGAMLESIGYQTRFVVEGYHDFENFEHVYLEVYCPRTGAWIALDATEQNAMGWSPPEALIRWSE